MKRTLTTPDFANYPADWHLSPVLDTGDFVFFSGVTGTRADLSVAEDPETQFRDAFGFLGDYLAVAGLSFSDVVEAYTAGALVRPRTEWLSRLPGRRYLDVAGRRMRRPAGGADE